MNKLPIEEDTSLASSISIATLTETINGSNRPQTNNPAIQTKSVDPSRFQIQRQFPSLNTFSIDLDPFSSSSSKSSSTLSLILNTNSPKKTPFDGFDFSSSTQNQQPIVDPFESAFESPKLKSNDPFAVFDFVINQDKKEMSQAEQDFDISQQINDDLTSDLTNNITMSINESGDPVKVAQANNSDDEDLTEKGASEFDVKINDPFLDQEQEENMDNAFAEYSKPNEHLDIRQVEVDDLPSLANEVNQVNELVAKAQVFDILEDQGDEQDEIQGFRNFDQVNLEDSLNNSIEERFNIRPMDNDDKNDQETNDFNNDYDHENITYNNQVQSSSLVTENDRVKF